MSATCHACKRTLTPGESAWADDWTVITAGGPRLETRYTCDACDRETR
jgi:RNase P subunit RPR2